MRTIKFRAFQDNIMYYQDVMYYRDESGICSTKYFLDKLYEDAALMQFTGLYDKNGKEIYEGDIVKAYNLIYTIEFKYGAFIFVNEVYKLDWRDIANKNRDYRLYEDVIENFEIIGNIYENPELL